MLWLYYSRLILNNGTRLERGRRMAAKTAHARNGGETVRVALVQMAAGLAPAENLRHALRRIREAARAGARIVCLQELFRTRYFCQCEDDRNFALAESIPGPTTRALAHAAAAARVVVIGSVFERRTEGLYHNTAVVFDADGRQAGVYRKMHIPDDPGFFEKFYFTPGDAAPASTPTPRPRGKSACSSAGPVVPRSGATDGSGRRADYFLPDGHRLARR